MKCSSVRTIFIFTFTMFCAAFFPMNNYAGEPVRGFADIHTHQMAEYSFAGAWIYGSHKGPLDKALHQCTGGSIWGGDHARTKYGILNEFLGQIPGTWGDTGVHFGKKYGYPFYTGWPRWDTIAHQQMPEDYLKHAHKKGLNLYVMSAVDFKPLCEAMPKNNMKYNYKCNEMVGADKQLKAAIDFAAQRNWVQIAHDPSEAREIINSGKLAMILAIEMTDLFDNDDWQKRLDYYYSLGVRSIQLGHQLNNRFTGVAPHHYIFKAFQILRNLGAINDTRVDDYIYLVTNSKKNPHGLTAEGRALLNTMMNKNMIVDISHMPEVAVRDLYAIAKARNYYPMVLSHGHLRAIMMGEKQLEEKTTPNEFIKYIKETGGMIGLRTGPDQVKPYPGSVVPNDCDGSTKSFAQAYQYGTKGLKVNIAFASDFGGFIQQLRPRFGPKGETCGASKDDNIIKSQTAKETQRLGSPLDYQGFGHIGLEGDIIKELQNFGVNASVSKWGTSPDTLGLEKSAEAFIQVWERCSDLKRTGPLPTIDMILIPEEH